MQASSSGSGDQQADEVRVIKIPNIHPKTNLRNLKKENNKHYTEDEIKSIKALDLPQGRTKASTIASAAGGVPDAKRDIYRVGNRYFSIDQGEEGKEDFHLGSGTFGVTKLAMDLDKGGSCVLKIIKNPSIVDFKIEQKGLHVAGQLIHVQERKVPEKGKEQVEILMNLAPGECLWKLAASTRKIATARYIDIGLSAMDSLHNLHKKGMLHNDFSGNNVICNPVDGTVQAIDFGLVSFQDPAITHISQEVEGLGRVYYRAPETIIGRCSEKSDVFSMGIILAELFNLGTRTGGTNFKMYDPYSLTEGNPKRIEPPELRKKMTDYIKELLNEDPYKRPSLPKALEFMTKIRKRYMDTAALLTQVGYLDLGAFAAANDTNKIKMLKSLKDKDQVFLVDRDGLYKHEYLAFRAFLNQWDIVAMPDVIQHDSSPSAKEVVQKHMRQRENDLYIYHCTYVDTDGINARTESMMSGENAQRFSKKIMASLNLEIRKLESALKTAGKNAGKIEADIARIQICYESIEGLLKDKKINYDKLFHELDILQKQLLSHHGVTRFFEVHLGVGASAARQKVITLAENVKEARNVHAKKR